MSSGMKKLMDAYDLKDSFRSIHPSERIFSHYYTSDQMEDRATRIDRSYHWGPGVLVKEAYYEPVAFSDHMGYIIHLAVPTQVCKLLTPHSKRFFRLTPEIIADELFQSRLDQCMEEWKEVRQQGLNILLWWELLVKPGVLKIE